MGNKAFIISMEQRLKTKSEHRLQTLAVQQQQCQLQPTKTRTTNRPVQVTRVPVSQISPTLLHQHFSQNMRMTTSGKNCVMQFVPDELRKVSKKCRTWKRRNRRWSENCKYFK